MIWFADRLNIRRNAATITGDDYYALSLGPVASHTLDIINNNISNSLTTQYAQTFFNLNGNNINIKEVATDFDSLSQEEMNNLQKSFDTLLSLDSKVISDESHKFPEWVKYKKQLKDSRTRFKINKIDFFDNPPDNIQLKVEENQKLVNFNKEIFLNDPLAE
jgi:hypothetical protein